MHVSFLCLILFTFWPIAVLLSCCSIEKTMLTTRIAYVMALSNRHSTNTNINDTVISIVLARKTYFYCIKLWLAPAGFLYHCFLGISYEIETLQMQA